MSSFTTATRNSTKARIALCGPSGSGKTWTALALAHAMGKRIAVIDTERGSASKYAGVNGWEFDTVQPGSFSPLSLVSLLVEAQGANYDVVVLDSWSHYWMGVDGMQEQADRRAVKGNTFSGWKAARPDERRMIDALTGYPGHVIVTLRVKTEYVIDTDDRGKKIPRKVGLKPEQREGAEYEFDLVGDLDQENTLAVSKSRIPGLTHAVIREPGVELGRQIADWLTDGRSIPDARDLRERTIAASSVEEIVSLGGEAGKLGLLTAAVEGTNGLAVSLRELLLARHEELKTGEESAA